MNDLYLLIIALILPGIAQAYIMGSYAKYRKKENQMRVTGFDVAKEILDRNEMNDVYIVETGGKLSDHYDSSRKTIRLSNDIYHGTSIASAAIAAHEAAHAIQDKEGHFFMKVRSFIFPVVNLGTRFAYIVLIAGIFLEMINLIWAAIGLIGLGLLFQLVTLPVEFNASKRAKDELIKYNLADQTSISGTEKMLRAAAFTYVAGVLATALQMLRLMLM